MVQNKESTYFLPLIPLDKPRGASKGGFRFKEKNLKIKKKTKLEKSKFFNNFIIVVGFVLCFHHNFHLSVEKEIWNSNLEL
jgi:hypothetical protein